MQQHVQTGKVRFIHSANKLCNYPSSFNRVRQILPIGNGVLMAGTTDGLLVFSDDFSRPEEIVFKEHQRRPDDPTSLANNDVKNILKASMEGKEPTEDMKPKESYLDKEAIERDQQFKSEIEKPKFPIQFNLDSFAKTHALLSEKKDYPLCSMQMSAYNPPSSNRQLIGDLAYLRVEPCRVVHCRS